MSKQPSLRILITTDTVGGVWSYTVELCKSLLPHNVDFHLVTTGAALKTDQKTEVYLLSNVTVYETDFLLEWMEDPWDSIIASGEYLLQLEKKINPDIIHLNSYAYGSLGWKAPVVVVAHSDVYSWWQAVKKESPSTAWNTYYQKVKTGISDADYLIAPSDWMMTAIRKTYHVSVAGEVIYNGRDAGLFHQSEKQPFVFSMGRIWDEAKNISLLVAAAPGINCPVKIAGDNSFENNQIAADGLNITYLGKLPLPEIAEVLSKAAVYVLPATYEPFGLSVLEAALAGCALVLGNIDSLKEIWGDCALYVQTDDEVSLATTINTLLHDEKLRLQYANASMVRAGKYSADAMAKKYLQVYHSFSGKNNLKQETEP